MMNLGEGNFEGYHKLSSEELEAFNKRITEDTNSVALDYEQQQLSPEQVEIFESELENNSEVKKNYEAYLASKGK